MKEASITKCCVLGALLIWGCNRPIKNDASTQTVASATPSESSVREAQTKRNLDECLRIRGEVASSPNMTGTPELDKKRHQVLGRAKALPVVFRRAPVRDRSLLPVFLAQQSAGIDDPKRAYATLRTLRSSLEGRRKQMRALLLPEGYFYAESPQVAQQLVTWIKLDDLFDEKELWLFRGTEFHRLEKIRYGYQHADGPLQGQPATIILFDRVATTKEELSPALHVDLSALAHGLGFDRMDIEHVSRDAMNAKLRYGVNGPWTLSSIRLDGPKAELRCEGVEPAQKMRVDAWRIEHAKREKSLEAIRDAILAQVGERLPFDEPKEEVGQQDGALRPAWEWSYRHQGTAFSFNKVSYQVFDNAGRPHPPQVCIDFVLDSFERGSGTWYRERDMARERVIGAIDFDEMKIPNRRSVERVVDFFRENAGSFVVWDLKDEDRIRYQDTERFLDFIKDHADDFLPSDLVVIHGPKGNEAHYHSFLVYERDPVSGMPVLLAGNAGKPRIQSWSSVMQSGQLRSIKHRLRPTPELLEKMLTRNLPGDLQPAVLQRPVQ